MYLTDRDIISAISQNQSTSETNFWIDMTVMISPDLDFRDVLAFMSSNVFNFDFEIGL
jgi:hypothetical protein